MKLSPIGVRTTQTPVHRALTPKPATLPKNSGKSLVMRKYQIRSLRTDGSVHWSEQIAPAMPAFEEGFSAFARGTLIKTTQGPVAVEDLDPGMKLIAADNKASTLMWAGSMTMVPTTQTPHASAAKLTRIMADSFGMARPSVDFMAGPNARVLTRALGLQDRYENSQVLVPVQNLLDGMNIISITPQRPVTTYHLCLRRHTTITAAGIDVETFHPGPGFERAMGPNMLSLFLSLFPHIKEPHDFGGLAHPRQSAAETEYT